jgi:hypothetical protein
VLAQNDSSDEGANEERASDKFSPTRRHRLSKTNSSEDFLRGDLKRQKISSPQFKNPIPPNYFDRVSPAINLLNPAIRTTLFPIGGFKHEEDCKTLLTALRCIPNIQEALEKHSHFWPRKIRSIEPDSSSTDGTFIQYARQALAGDDPIKIAKIVQAVASVTLDIKIYEKLVLIVDRLIVSDDEYSSTLEGMECTLEQGRLLIEMGKIRRSW